MSVEFVERCKRAEVWLRSDEHLSYAERSRPTVRFMLRHGDHTASVDIAGDSSQRLEVYISGSADDWAPLFAGLRGGLHRAWRRDLLQFSGDIAPLVPQWHLLVDLERALRLGQRTDHPEQSAGDQTAPAEMRRSSPSDLASGPPVVLLHGAGQDKHAWDAMLRNAPEGYAFFAPDLPAHGADHSAAASDYGNLCQWLAHYLDQQSLDRPILVGHSFAGMLALQFVLRHPSRCGGAVIVNSTASARGAWPEDKLSAIASDPASWFPIHFAAACSPKAPVQRVNNLVMELRRSLRPDVMISDMRMFGQANVFDELAGFTLPFGVIHGLDDWSVPPQLGKSLAERCGGTFDGIIDAGHFPHIEQPSAFNDALSRVLSSIAV